MQQIEQFVHGGILFAHQHEPAYGRAGSEGRGQAVYPRAMAIVVPIFLVVAVVSRYVSLGSLVAAAVAPPLVLALGYPGGTGAVTLAMGVLIAVRHRDNMRRMWFGTEGRIRSVPPTSDAS